MKTVDEALHHATEDVRRRVNGLPGRPASDLATRSRRGRLVAAIAGIAVLVAAVGTSAWFLLGPGRSRQTPTAPPAVVLGTTYLWPQNPMPGSPAEVAAAFATQVLGWEGATITVEDAAAEIADLQIDWPTPLPDEIPITEGQALVRIDHPSAAAPVHLTINQCGDSGWVVNDAVTRLTLNLGLGVSSGGAGNVAGDISFPVVSGAAQEQVVVHLFGSGQQVLDSSSTEEKEGILTIPIDDPYAVDTVLVRYLDARGIVIAAGGGVWDMALESGSWFSPTAPDEWASGLAMSPRPHGFVYRYSEGTADAQRTAIFHGFTDDEGRSFSIGRRRFASTVPLTGETLHRGDRTFTVVTSDTEIRVLEDVGDDVRIEVVSSDLDADALLRIAQGVTYDPTLEADAAPTP
jgi:hypothetical protein